MTIAEQQSSHWGCEVNDGLRKLTENLLPPLIEESMPRRVLYWLFWLTTAFVAWLFIVSVAARSVRGPRREHTRQ